MRDATGLLPLSFGAVWGLAAFVFLPISVHRYRILKARFVEAPSQESSC